MPSSDQLASTRHSRLTLALVLLYTYGNFFALPYTGMYFIESSGRIVRVSVDRSGFMMKSP